MAQKGLVLCQITIWPVNAIWYWGYLARFITLVLYQIRLELVQYWSILVYQVLYVCMYSLISVLLGLSWFSTYCLVYLDFADCSVFVDSVRTAWFMLIPHILLSLCWFRMCCSVYVDSARTARFMLIPCVLLGLCWSHTYCSVYVDSLCTAQFMLIPHILLDWCWFCVYRSVDVDSVCTAQFMLILCILFSLCWFHMYCSIYLDSMRTTRFIFIPRLLLGLCWLHISTKCWTKKYCPCKPWYLKICLKLKKLKYLFFVNFEAWIYFFFLKVKVAPWYAKLTGSFTNWLPPDTWTSPNHMVLSLYVNIIYLFLLTGVQLAMWCLVMSR